MDQRLVRSIEKFLQSQDSTEARLVLDDGILKIRVMIPEDYTNITKPHQTSQEAEFDRISG